MNTEKLRELRDRTNLSMTDCKSALLEANEDVDQAILILQKKNLIKKADALIVPTEGMVFARCFSIPLKSDTDPQLTSILTEVNCQTDFAANTDVFKSLVKDIAFLSITEKYNDIQPLIDKTSAQLGEKIVLNRTTVKRSSNGSCFAVYNHFNSKIAVMMEYIPDPEKREESAKVAEQTAMHIAAQDPPYLSVDAIPAEANKNMLAFFEDQLANPEPGEKAKPKIIWPKILEGKMKAWHREVALLEQGSIVSYGRRIGDLWTDAGATPISFIKYELGRK